MNLAQIVDYEIKAQTPILMCSVPGYDASGRVDDFAAELNMQITSIAIGTLYFKEMFRLYATNVLTYPLPHSPYRTLLCVCFHDLQYIYIYI